MNDEFMTADNRPLTRDGGRLFAVCGLGMKMNFGLEIL